MEFKAFPGQEGVATASNLALVSIVHVSIEMNIVFRLRHKLLIAVWENENNNMTELKI